VNFGRFPAESPVAKRNPGQIAQVVKTRYLAANRRDRFGG
jgi:hypothetical protein